MRAGRAALYKTTVAFVRAYANIAGVSGSRLRIAEAGGKDRVQCIEPDG